MTQVTMSAPLYEDPITGGPTDPTVIWNGCERQMFMFYTQRRPNPHAVGVSWVHGTKIAVASSEDGARWLYRGTLDLDLDAFPGENTFWAPEVVDIDGVYHMFVPMIVGVPTDWHGRSRMLHYTSRDLWRWAFVSEIDLASNRVIDPCVAREPDGTYSMWYKDEDLGGVTCRAVSRDLNEWSVLGQEVFDCHQEGPNVFDLGGRRWMISDYWHGLVVYRQEDVAEEHCGNSAPGSAAGDGSERNAGILGEGNAAEGHGGSALHRWTRCPDILDRSSGRAMDQGFGHHADIWVNPKDGRATIFYFCHPYAHDDGSPRAAGEPADPTAAQLSVVQAAELRVEGDVIVCDRGAVPVIDLG
ncbi:hypothetical protein [Bifidobacterium biavatii]|uniref:Glycosyl hydrolase family protein n=1 Tax=Bifidobacterium biavatii DSM 23969 TaxID=1437608 RepID=A0A087A1N0_9BIFI|nr:hypothetical protein [Bifidobacterium biavatii]KFI52680.1 glycosyl hydrolase family protein [Bifidobacterium biavatii DSM 23969]